MLIGRSQRRDIGRAVYTVGVQRAAAGPVEEDGAVYLCQVGVCHDPRPTSVAVGKRMDPDKAVMQARFFSLAASMPLGFEGLILGRPFKPFSSAISARNSPTSCFKPLTSSSRSTTKPSSSGLDKAFKDRRAGFFGSNITPENHTISIYEIADSQTESIRRTNRKYMLFQK